MKLTVSEIYDLAFLAGLPLEDRPEGDDAETAIEVYECPADGVLCETTQETKRFRLVARFEDYPDEGTLGLGPEL